MTFLTSTGKPLPQHVVDSAKAAGDSEVSRREFLAIASAFGATAATALWHVGHGVPLQWLLATKMGGPTALPNRRYAD